MGENSKIAWTDHTFNPWMGCSKVSAGCQHCYAEALMDTQYGKVHWGDHGTRVRTAPANWRKPHKWNKESEAAGVRRKVFCASLADVFEDREELEPWRADLFAVIDETPHLDWLLLTKRPENIHLDRVRHNVWLGTSIENEEAARKRMLPLMKAPAVVRFLSCEPLLGPVDLAFPGTLPKDDFPGYQQVYDKIHWVIVGGESGRNFRPCKVHWVADIVKQCREFDVPVFVKQDSGAQPGKQGRIPDEMFVQQFPEGT